MPGSDVNSNNFDVFAWRNIGDRYRYTRMCGRGTRCSASGVRRVGSSRDVDDAPDGTRGGRSGDMHAADTGHGEAAQGRDAKASGTIDEILYCATSQCVLYGSYRVEEKLGRDL